MTITVPEFKYKVGQELKDHIGHKYAIVDQLYSVDDSCWYYELEDFRESEYTERFKCTEDEIDHDYEIDDSFKIVGTKIDIQPHWEEYYQYLEHLRLSGVNMYGAANQLAKKFVFELSLEQAGTVLNNWMHNYTELNKKYNWKSEEEYE